MASKQQNDPIRLLKDIDDRSRRNAFGLPQQEEAQNIWHGIVFSIDNEQLVMPLDQVREIIKYPALAPVPGAKAWVKGIANIRGTLLPIMDLKGFLTGEQTRPDRRTRVLVVDGAGISSGLLVDEVLGMKHFQADSYNKAAPKVAKTLAPFISGSYGQGGKQWAVFDPEQLMENPDFIQVAA